MRAKQRSGTFPLCDVLEPPTQLSGPVGDPNGFAWNRRKNGEIVIEHHGRRATVLRGRRAAEFLDEVTAGDEQEIMARLTGNYKHGNERESRNHPRNR